MPRISDKSAGLYVHVPFCLRKCHYCNFTSLTDISRIPAYIKAVIQEMDLTYSLPFQFDTLFFGGGTPSIIHAADIGKLIENAYRRFDFLPDTEISLEANPGTLTREKLLDLSAVGVNRLTIGIQSFQARILNLLGRLHSAEQGIDAVHLARGAGFRNLGIDLIYGIPDQTLTELTDDLNQAVFLEPAHISAYMLTIEPNTHLKDMVIKGTLTPLPEQNTADFFRLVSDFLTAHGYRQYEISNFARTEKDISRHNVKYWTLSPYLGLGPAAHSYLPPVRAWNYSSVNRYLTKLSSGQAPMAGWELPDQEQQLIEAVYLGLRTASGLDMEALNQPLKISFNEQYQEIMAELLKQGMAEKLGNRFRLTRAGMLYHEAIVRQLI